MSERPPFLAGRRTRDASNCYKPQVTASIYDFAVSLGDADTLRRITPVPRVAWATLWLAGSVLALWIGGRLLV